MWDDFVYFGIEGDFQDFVVVFQIDIVGWFELEIVCGVGFGDGFKFGVVFQVVYWEVFDGVVVYVFQQCDGGFQWYNVICCVVVQWVGGDFNYFWCIGGRDQVVDYCFVLFEQCVVGSYVGEDLVDVLWLYLVRNFVYYC